MNESEAGMTWKDRGLRSNLAVFIATAWSIYTLSYLCNVFFYLGVVVYPLTHRAISAGLICILVYLLFPPRKGMPIDKLKWYDVAPIVIIIAGCAYIAVNANALVAEGRLIPYRSEMILASLLFIAVIEATRRTIGWV